MGKKERLVTSSAEETRRFFRKFAERLKRGDVVGFIGELGAGKTTAIQAVLSAFGIRGGESPTFIMVRPYDHVIHVDAYRLNSLREAETTGLSDVLTDHHHIILVEWADKIRSLLPKDTIWVTMAHRGEDTREIVVEQP